MNEAVRTLANAMLTTPVRHPLDATVREIREFFDDDHVHAALIVGPAGYLAAVVERGDITHSRGGRGRRRAAGATHGPHRARRHQPG